MKKIILSILIAVFLIPHFSIAAENFDDKVVIAQNYATKTFDIPDNLQLRADYEARTDGQPVYSGRALLGTATSSETWIIYKFTYDGSDQITLRQTAYGAWDNRATLTYQ